MPTRSNKGSADFRRIVINLCLSVDVAEAEDEEFCIVDTVEFGSERLDFRVYGFGGGVGRAVVVEVEDLVRVLVESRGNSVE